VPAPHVAVIAGHSRPKDGAASLAYAQAPRPVIHERAQRKQP
jgi:hypothetical protein